MLKMISNAMADYSVKDGVMVFDWAINGMSH
jgi:hypothetical protein